MITNNVTSGNTALSELITKVMDKFDTDKDKKLSQSEFTDFLTGLLEGGLPATKSAVSTQAAAPADIPVKVGEYRSRMGGFDHVKMDNPSMQGAMTSKYKAARIFQDFPPQPESLPAVVERLKAIGVNATHDGKDKIDFGDGYGQIDVIQGAYPGGGVAWQWIPQGEIHT